ncbi:hypothetical protein V8E51_015906 [Hyaloscypha variabilis]
MAPGSFDDYHGHFDFFGNSFNSSDLGTSMDDGFCSTESGLSSDNAESSPGSSSVRWPTPAEDIFTLPGDHSQLQDTQEYLNHDHGSEAMREFSHDNERCFHMPRNCNIISDDLLSNFDWEASAQLNNYTFDQALPSSIHNGNTASGFLDIPGGYDRDVSNEVPTQVPWTVDVPQTPVYLLTQEAHVERQVSNALIGDQNVLTYMTTPPTMATRSMRTIGHPSISIQEDNSRYPEALDTCFSTLAELPLSLAPYSHLPIQSPDLYVNHVETIPADMNPSPSNTNITSCFENSLQGTSQLGQTPQSSAGSSKMVDDSVMDNSVELLVHLKHRKKLQILPAPTKALVHVISQPVYSPQMPPAKRSDRRRFTDKEKKNIQEVRKKGSCVVCMVNKSKCDTNEICEGCQKMALAKNTKLAANHICIRGGLLVFRQNIPDFHDTQSRLKMLPKNFEAPWRTIMIGHRVTISDTESALFPQKVRLIVRTRGYKTCDMDNNLVWSGRATRSAAAYAIDPDTFPTASQLDEWGRNLLEEYSHMPDSQPDNMDVFLLSYLNAKPALQHHRLADLTVRLVSLSTWLLVSHPMIDVTKFEDQNQQLFDIQDDRVESRLSQVARSQLRLIAAQGFEATEREFFSEIDSLMRPMGCDPRSALIVGLCLRRISLLYRVSFKRYKQFFIDSNVDRRRDKSKAMYEVLVTEYSLVYSGAKSPYSKRWKIKDCLDALGYNSELFGLFLEVRNGDWQYCEDNRGDEDDLHLTTLFVDRKEGGGPRTWK